MYYQKHYCSTKQLIPTVLLLFLFIIQFTLPAFSQKNGSNKKKEYNYFGIGLQTGTHALVGVDFAVGLTEFYGIASWLQPYATFFIQFRS